MDVNFTSGMIGALDTQLVFEFFQGFVKSPTAHREAETAKAHRG